MNGHRKKTKKKTKKKTSAKSEKRVAVAIGLSRRGKLLGVFVDAKIQGDTVAVENAPGAEVALKGALNFFRNKEQRGDCWIFWEGDWYQVC